MRITNSTASDLWKFADDTSVSEVIPTAGVSSLPHTVNEVHKWSNDNKFQFNLGKCKELRINFTTQPYTDDPLNINGEPLSNFKKNKTIDTPKIVNILFNVSTRLQSASEMTLLRNAEIYIYKLSGSNYALIKYHKFFRGSSSVVQFWFLMMYM